MDRLTRRLIIARQILVAALIMALLALALASPAAAEEPRGPLLLQKLLLDGDYARLEDILAKRERAYLSGEAPEDVVSKAYGAFASVNPAFAARLDDWVAAYPDSHRPFLARGNFQRNIGWVLRGTDLATNTTDRQFELMEQRFKRAAEDFKVVLQRKPELGLTYGYAINTLMSGGDYDTIDRFLELGLKADPRSYSLRSTYLYSLMPWWSGDRAFKGKSFVQVITERYEMRHYPVLLPAELPRFVARIETDAKTTPSLKPLLGYVDYTIAEMLARKGQRQEADSYYRRTNEIGGGDAYLADVAVNLYWLDRDDEALAIFDRLLEADPFDKKALLYRARIYRIKRDYDTALATIDRALALSPNETDPVWEKANILKMMGRRDDAITVFNRALVYGEFNPVLIHARGMMHLSNSGGKNTLAEDDLRRATVLLPTRAQYWFDYGTALSYRLQCRGIEAYQIYVDMCPYFGNKCRAQDLDIALNYINSKTVAQSCFGPSSPT